MIGEIVLAGLSFITGMVIPKVLGLHVHKYDIVYHQPVTAFPNGIRYGKSSTESYEGANYDNKRTFITCKQCTLCHKRFVRVSDGSDREFKFDTEFILTHIDMEIKKNKAEEEEALLNRMNDLLKTPEQKEAEEKAKAVEAAHRKSMVEESPSDKMLRLHKENPGGYVEHDHEGNIVYVAHRRDGDDVHIVKKKKRTMGSGKLR